ncbi:MAG: EAL domain-containing protein [Granulosicoccus sp.]
MISRLSKWIPITKAPTEMERHSFRNACKSIALGVIVAATIIIYTAHVQNFKELNSHAQAGANAVALDVGDRIGVIKTVLASLEGLYYVSPDLGTAKLEQFTRKLLDNAPYIAMLGRYESILRDERENYESRMTYEGNPRFTLKEFDEQWKPVDRADRSQYYPVSLLEPLEPATASLIGFDFGSVSGMAAMLKTVAKDNTIIMAMPPDAWPYPGNLLVFSPVYRGKETPDSEQALLKQSSGGFWVNINFAELLSGITPLTANFDIQVEIVNGDTRQKLLEQSARLNKDIYFTDFYEPNIFEETWVTSDSVALVISLKKPLGLTKSVILIAAVAISVVLLMAALLLAHIAARQAAIRDHLESHNKLIDEREKAQKTLNTVQDAIITLDSEFCILHLNSAATILLNIRHQEAVSRQMAELLKFCETGSTDTEFDIRDAFANLQYSGKNEFDVIPAGYCSDNFVLRLSLSSSQTHDGDVSGHVVVLRDISHERRLSKKLAYQANYDALTGCTNRHFFEEKLDALVNEIHVNHSSHTLCYMDLDQFKIINDSCGHRAGDQLLIELTHRLRARIRENDILSRIGGDEFGLIIVDSNPEAASAVYQRVFDLFQNFVFKHEQIVFSVTASIGVVHLDDSYTSMNHVLAAADIACYSAKDSGRNSLSVFSKHDKGMQERSVEFSWLSRLQTALQENQFRLYLQPVVSLSKTPDKAEITHFEFLLRLTDVDGSEITPWRIIQAAERYNLMRDVDRWVIDNALQTVSRLKAGPGKHCSYSINLSGQSAADKTFKTYLQEKYTQYQIDPAMIWFELTETAAISHFSVAVDLMKSIQNLGSKVALDDFGSGLSSFGYLKNLPVDVIKIDGQFVKEIAKNPIDREMVRAIHDVGQAMNIQSVAEFVEDEETLAELAKIGIDYAQGYLLGKPQKIDDAIALLSASNRAA